MQMKFEKGQDVVVDFRGVEHPGVVLRHSRGQVLCRIAIDPEMDYGDGTGSLGLHSIVCVNATNVRHTT